MASEDTIHAIQLHIKTFLTLNCPFILLTMYTQCNFAQFSNPICTYEFINKSLPVWKPFMDWMRLSEYL